MYQKYADLHNHTDASDGLLTPDGLIKEAADKKIAAVGITDHDTTDGLYGAKIAGKKYGVEIVPGIELNTQIYNVEIHVLGYFLDYKLSWLQDFLKDIRKTRYARAKNMVENLNKIHNMNLSFSNVEKIAHGKKNIGRAHIARAMTHEGIVKNISEAFRKYIGVDCPAYVKRNKISMSKGIDIIRRAGGVAVLAHPGLINDDGLVEKIISSGFSGIEVYHSKHTLDQSKYYATLADRRGLLKTGGSDSHGESTPALGDVKVEYQIVKDLRNIAKFS